MDSDIGRWVYEFLSRAQKTKNLRISDTLITRISRSDFHSKKTTLLRNLHNQLSAISITEDMLRKLEVFEELHRRSGYPIPAALPAAYCAVAVDSTVKYLELEPSPSNNHPYISAVDRIWRRQIRAMMKSGSVLSSEELKRWSSDIEASFHDTEVMERFGTLNSRKYAVQKLRILLDETQKDLCSFLELAASMTNAPHTTAASTSQHLQTGAPVENQSKDAPAAEDQSPYDHIENVGAVDHAMTKTTADEDKSSCDLPIENVGANADPAKTNATAAEDQSLCDPIENVGANADPAKTNATAAEDQSLCDLIENVGANADPAKTKATAAEDNTTAAEGQSPCDPIEIVGANADPAKTKATAAEDQSPYDPIENWEKSADGSEEKISNNASRVQLPSPKCRKRSPLKTYEPQKIVRRRKAKKWSVLEEDTLRAAVKKLGEGNWKSILDSHKDIFDERTQVDLKDKWRNLKRYGAT